jgi:hypothetical protein
MIDHIYLPATDLKRSDPFYGGMLGTLGKSERWHFKAQAGYPDLTGFGESGIPGFWLKASKTTCAELYVAFAAKNGRRWTRPTRQRLPMAARIMARQGCGRSSIPAITRPMCSIPTAAMWRSATSPSSTNKVCAAHAPSRRADSPDWCIPRLGSCAASRFTADGCRLCRYCKVQQHPRLTGSDR